MLSRHIFIGLTGAFLKMKDLRIDCPNVDFSLEGGMCLLRRMSDLERLHVKSMREGQFTERDLAWLLPDLTPEQRTLVVDQLRIEFRGLAGFKFVRNTVQVAGRTQPETCLNQVAVISRCTRHVLRRFFRFRHNPASRYTRHSRLWFTRSPSRSTSTCNLR